MRNYVKQTLAKALGCDEGDLDERFVDLIVYIFESWDNKVAG